MLRRPPLAGMQPCLLAEPRSSACDLAPAPPGRPDPPDRAHQPLRPDPDGLKVAIFYTKLHNRLIRPLLAADQPQAPPELRAALRTIDRHIDRYITRAPITKAA